jgi:hypothetical protein
MCMAYHPVEGLHSRLFAHHGPFFDISAGNGLESSNKPATDTGGPHYDPTYYTKILSHLMASYVITGCYDHRPSKEVV